MSIYVEAFIVGNLDELWEKTQTPTLHQQWDLRFTDIEYLPHPDENTPQQFLYQTRIGLGMAIKGMGETVGTSINDKQRTSALKFWSDDPKSLITVGSGYWKYEQMDGGVRFLTSYDYETRFGGLGKIFDHVIFRPIIGWATAWSFDCLRLWIEQGITPAISIKNSLIYALARFMLVFIWLYHGLVPKLLASHQDELVMMINAGVPNRILPFALHTLGVIEIAFAIFLLFTWTRRWTLLLNIPLMIVALLSVTFTSPSYLIAAFNPVTLNFSVIILALIGYLASTNIPSAGRCLRKDKKS